MVQEFTILIVEDNGIIALDLEQSVIEMGYSIGGVVRSGEEAVDVAARLSPDLVLMDVHLSGCMDGIQTAQELQKHNSLPIIFLSERLDSDTISRAMLTDPFGYLSKPFRFLELKNSIEIALRKAEQNSALAKLGAVTRQSRPTPSAVAEGMAERLSFLRSIPALSTALVEQDFEVLAECSHISSINAGKNLVFQDQVAEKAFIVKTGRVSITRSSDSGRELILGLLGAGDLLGMLYMLPGCETFGAARSEIDSQVLCLPRAEFANLLDYLPALKALLFEELGKRFHESYELASNLAHSKVETRIVSTLNSLVVSKRKPGSEDVRIFLTRRELAELTGTTPETAIRITKQLERDRILDLSRPGIIKVINIDGLRRIVP